MTALEQLVKCREKIGFIPNFVPLMLDDSEAFTLHVEVGTTQKPIMEFAKENFVPLFADKCMESKAFALPSERTVDGLFGFFGGVFKKGLRIASRFSGEWLEMSDVLMKCVEQCVEEIHWQVYAKYRKETEGMQLVFSPEAMRVVNSWMHRYLLNRTYSLKAIMNDFRVSGLASLFQEVAGSGREKTSPVKLAWANFTMARDVYDELIRRGVLDEDKLRNPMYFEGLKVGAALVADVDFFLLAER